MMIFLFGLLISILWWGVAEMSRGIPREVCETINSWTLHIFEPVIFQMSNGFYYETLNNDMPTEMFLIVFALIFGVYLAAITWIRRNPFSKRTLILILAFAGVFRWVTLESEPIHENDFYRYFWDGRSILAGVNPYLYAPSDLFMFEEGLTEDYHDPDRDVIYSAQEWTDADTYRLQRLIDLRDQSPVFYDRIGHRQVPTIYPPVAQGVFAATTAIRPDSIVFMKAVFVLFDAGVIFLVLWMLRRLKMNPNLVIVYAWSPLMIREVSIAGHYDPVAVFFLFLALACSLGGRGRMAGAGLAFSALSKLFAVVLVPMLWLRNRRGSVGAFLGIAVLGYVPFLLWNMAGSAVFEGLTVYGKEWVYNASLFALIHKALGVLGTSTSGSLVPAKLAAGGIYLITLFILVFRGRKNTYEWLYSCFLAVAFLFLINPVGDPWYFCWVIPFLCFFPQRSWILLSGLLVFSYINFQSDLPLVHWKWAGIPAVSWIIYVPFAGLWLWEHFLRGPVMGSSQELSEMDAGEFIEDDDATTC